MCPGAEQLLGELAELRSGAERIVTLAFHVDYFNDPWKDRFSQKLFTQREIAYNRVHKRNDLVFTPMLMVDGRVPMLGTDRRKAQAALEQALTEKPAVSLDLRLAGPSEPSAQKTLNVTVEALTRDVAGRDVLVGVATFEDPVTTHVEAGENAGKALVERFAVRRLAVEFIRLNKSGSKTLTFPIQIERDWDAERSGLAAFVQDEKTGKVYQASTVRWKEPSGRRQKGTRETESGNSQQRD